MDMSSAIHQCQCADCRASQAGPALEQHHQMNLFLSRLDEQQRRWYAALESRRIGPGGDTLVAQITGLDVETIRRGRRELAVDWADRPSAHVRQPGGGQPPVEKRTRRSSRH